MANLPSKERPGKTVSTGISIDAEAYKAIKAYALEKQWSFSKGIENLAKIGLAEEAKKKPAHIYVEKRNEHRRPRAS